MPRVATGYSTRPEAPWCARMAPSTRHKASNPYLSPRPSPQADCVSQNPLFQNALSFILFLSVRRLDPCLGREYEDLQALAATVRPAEPRASRVFHTRINLTRFVLKPKVCESKIDFSGRNRASTVDSTVNYSHCSYVSPSDVKIPEIPRRANPQKSHGFQIQTRFVRPDNSTEATIARDFGEIEQNGESHKVRVVETRAVAG